MGELNLRQWGLMEVVDKFQRVAFLDLLLQEEFKEKINQHANISVNLRDPLTTL